MARFLPTIFKPVSPSGQKLRKAILHPSSLKTVIAVSALWICVLLASCVLQIPQRGQIRSFGESLSALLLPLIGVTVFSFLALRGLPSIGKKDTAIVRAVSEIYMQGGYEELRSTVSQLKEAGKPSPRFIGTCAVFFTAMLALTNASLRATAGTGAYGFFVFLEVSLMVAACAILVGFLTLHHQSRVATALSQLSEREVGGIVGDFRLERVAEARMQRQM